jgi:SagB-type dehydrogenase family enzyme
MSMHGIEVRQLDATGKFHQFHRVSSAQPYQLRQEAALSSADWPPDWSVTYSKDYPRLPFIALPRTGLPALTLEQALIRRTSERSARSPAMNLGQLAALLEGALGLRPSIGGDALSRRRYPSAGARFTTEAYVWVTDCDGLPPGLYYYLIQRHGLRALRGVHGLDEAKRRIFGADWICQSQMLIILSAAMWRSYRKYGERSYRYAHLEAGHVMQNLCLAATALDLPLTPTGGFADTALWDALDVGDIDEIPLYVATIP